MKTIQMNWDAEVQKEFDLLEVSYPNSCIHLQTEMREGRSLLKCEASLSLQVKVITEQREATGWRGQSKASVLHSHYYPFAG